MYSFSDIFGASTSSARAHSRRGVYQTHKLTTHTYASIMCVYRRHISRTMTHARILIICSCEAFCLRQSTRVFGILIVHTIDLYRIECCCYSYSTHDAPEKKRSLADYVQRGIDCAYATTTTSSGVSVHILAMFSNTHDCATRRQRTTTDDDDGRRRKRNDSDMVDLKRASFDVCLCRCICCACVRRLGFAKFRRRKRVAHVKSIRKLRNRLRCCCCCGVR